MPDAIPEWILKRAIPELRNPRYARAYRDGYDKRLSAELAGHPSDRVPLYSHNTTYQSLFARGWLSVDAHTIRLHCDIAKGASCLPH